MSNLEVVRAWKDPDFRATLSGVMPDHPAGQIELADPGLDGSAAASRDLPSGTFGLNFSVCFCFTKQCTHKCI